MVQHGQEYKTIIDANEKRPRDKELLAKLREKIQLRIYAAKENSIKRYNLRTRHVDYQVRDIVYRKNHMLSDASKHFSRKLAPRHVACFA